jgi:hypothetical protein
MLQVDVKEEVTMKVVVTVGIHLYYIVVRRGKERELYLASGWIQRIRELELP